MGVGGRWLVQMMPEEARADVPPLPQGLQLFVQVFQLCAATGLSAWLLVAGIALVRRRPWSRPHHLGWSVAKLLLSIVGLGAGIAYAGETARTMTDQFAQGPLNFSVTPAHVVAFLAVVFVWYLVWPVFLLIWFTRDPVREEIAAWAETDRQMI